MSTGSGPGTPAVVGWRLMTWLCAPVTARTCVTSVARLSAGALISTARSGTSPRRAATELFTTASTPGMPSAAAPPKVSCAWVAPVTG